MRNDAHDGVDVIPRGPVGPMECRRPHRTLVIELNQDHRTVDTVVEHAIVSRRSDPDETCVIEVRDHLSALFSTPAMRESETDVAFTVDDLIELMGLGAFRDKFVAELSTGSRRIVDLSMSIAHDPTVLLLDEPSSGIAQRETEALGPLLKRIREEAGCALLVIEHDMPLITSLSDSIVALDLGQVLMQGAPQEVLADERVINAYLGNDPASINRSTAEASTPAKKTPRSRAKAAAR